MNTRIPIQFPEREERLVFVLVDAAELRGMLTTTPFEAYWKEAKEYILESGDFGGLAATLRKILNTLHASGKFAGTWLERCWLAERYRGTGRSKGFRWSDGLERV